MTEKYVAPYEQSRWLFCSSLFFLFPAIYGYYNMLYSYANLIVMTSVISANFWRKATYSWRRTLDRAFAKISFIVFLINGIIYFKYKPYIITGYSGLVILSYCYYIGDVLLYQNNNNWYKYHFIFHILLTYELFIILDSIVKYRIINTIK